MNPSHFSRCEPPGFEAALWQMIDSMEMARPGSMRAEHVRRSSAQLTWPGLFVWQQIGPAGDLYIPPLDSHCILVRRSTPTVLLQRQGRLVSDGPWQPGGVVVIPAGLPSFWRSPAARDNIHVNLNPAWLQRAAGDDVILKSCFGRRDAVLTALAHALLASLDSDTSLQPAFAENIALAIAVHLVENDTQAATPRSAPLTRQQQDMLVEAVGSGLAEPWSLSRMAALAGHSPFHFARAFKTTFGITPHGYVRARRMEAAAHWLRCTRDSIAEIGHKTGHRTAAHFAQCFKQHWGMTPTAYRKGAG